VALIFVPAGAIAQDSVVVIDGEGHIFNPTPVNIEGHTFVPVRPLFEILGANVHWDNTTNTIIFYMDENEIHIPIEGYIVLVDGEETLMDISTRLINSYTFIPLRFVSETLGYAVSWDREARTASIIIPESYDSEARTILITIPQSYSIIYSSTGLASWYGGQFHGRRTSSGEVFNQHELTAAHRTLPFGTLVNVTSIDTGKTVQVRINDRGPHIQGRIIDLSMAAAEAIGLRSRGIGQVKIEVLQPE